MYVAGGDAGLLTLDATGFTAPHAVRSYRFGAKTSITDGGTFLFAAEAANGLSAISRFSSGSLAQERTWATALSHTVHDLRNNVLLTSSGSTLRVNGLRENA